MMVDLPPERNHIYPWDDIHESGRNSPEDVWWVTGPFHSVISVRISDFCLQLGLQGTSL